MPLIETKMDTHSEAINEEVIYQNPLLFLKIGEISLEAHHYNAHLNDKLCVEDACTLLNLSYHYPHKARLR